MGDVNPGSSPGRERRAACWSWSPRMANGTRAVRVRERGSNPQIMGSSRMQVRFLSAPPPGGSMLEAALFGCHALRWPLFLILLVMFTLWPRSDE
jgi:hypothetical protein